MSGISVLILSILPHRSRTKFLIYISTVWETVSSKNSSKTEGLRHIIRPAAQSICVLCEQMLRAATPRLRDMDSTSQHLLRGESTSFTRWVSSWTEIRKQLLRSKFKVKGQQNLIAFIVHRNTQATAQTYTYIIQMPYLLFKSCGIMWALISLPPQTAELLRRAQVLNQSQ